MKVCLVGYSAEGLLTSSAGGSEWQSALLAMSLAGRGHDVTFVVTGYDGIEDTIAGVRLRAGWDPDRGLRFVRAATYRYPRLLAVLRAQEADVYYSRGASFFTPFVYARLATARPSACLPWRVTATSTRTRRRCCSGDRASAAFAACCPTRPHALP